MTGLFSAIHLLIILCVSWNVLSAVDKLKCTDWNNRYIDDGQEFYPKKEDPCYVCICNKGYTERCKSVRCATPEPDEKCDQYVSVEGACCEFKCGNGKTKGGGRRNATLPVDRGTTDGSSDSITTLGLRLVASTVTSFLVLALLLFMVHRIRQRRLMLAMRRYHNNRRREQLDDLDHDGFTQEYVGIQSPPPYDDPPPPYSPPKPPQGVLPSESPPPYESVDSNQNINNNNNNNDVQCQTERSELMSVNNQNVTCNMNSSLICNNTPLNNQSGISSCVPVQTDNNNDGVSELSSISFSDNRVIYNPNSSVTSAASNYTPNANSLHPHSFQFYMNTVNLECNRSAYPISHPLSSSLCMQNSNQVLDRSLDLDRTDDSSSFASDTFSPYPRRPYQENNLRTLGTLQGYIPPYLQDGTDSDDLSTEISVNALAMQPIRNQVENSSFPPMCNPLEDGSYKPAKISYIDGQNSKMNTPPSVSNDSECIKEQNNMNCCHSDVASSSSIIATSGNDSTRSGVCRRQLDIQDVSVSDLATSSVDNTPAKEFRDAQQLRELRLSNLLRNPSGDSSEEQLSPVSLQFSGQNLPRSHSDVSMFSVCSETGEKKLSHLAGIALRNDAPYPDNVCKGRQSLSMSLPADQEELNKFQINQKQENLHNIVNQQTCLDNAEYQQDCEEIAGKTMETSGKCGNVNGNIGGSKKKKRNGKNKNRSSNLASGDKNSSVSECSNSSSEKNCISDKKFLIKSQQKGGENKDNHKDTTAVPTPRNRNKHRTHRHSSGSLPSMKSKRRPQYCDTSESTLLPPFDHQMQVSAHQSVESGNQCNGSGLNDKNSYPEHFSGGIQQSDEDIRNKSGKYGQVKEYGNVDNPRLKKNSKITKTITTTEYSKINNFLNSGKNPLITSDFNNRQDPTNLQENASSNFSVTDNPVKERPSGTKHMFDRQWSHKSGKSHNDASLLCPGKSFVHRKSRNSKRSKNRKSYPGAVVTEPKVIDKNLISPPVVSYMGVKKETEFSSDGVKEKLTFPLPNGIIKHGDINNDMYTIEKCSYV